MGKVIKVSKKKAVKTLSLKKKGPCTCESGREDACPEHGKASFSTPNGKRKLLLKKKVEDEKNASQIRAAEILVKRNERAAAHEKSAGKFLLDMTCQKHPVAKKCRDLLDEYPREMLRDRLGLIFCEILGLCGTEAV